MQVLESLEVLQAGDPRQVGPYRIVARLGAGGMGRVYLGWSRGGRPVAVKVVRQELAEDREFKRRFAREVTAARRVNGVFTAGVVNADPDGSPAWLATVYVPGVSLSDAVAAHGRWPQASVLALGAGLAEALEAIHAAAVVHRDLKPSNILLAADGPRVIDFGISVAGEASALTQTGKMIGTPGFMSPEQLTGKPVGPSSDVFSMGAVLAFAASGAGPFGSGSAHALNFRAVYEKPNLRDLPPKVRVVVARCLAKDPGRRPSVAELLNQLAEAIGDGRPITAVLTETRWLPVPVAANVRSHTAALQHGGIPPAANLRPTRALPSGLMPEEQPQTTDPDTGSPVSRKPPWAAARAQNRPHVDVDPSARRVGVTRRRALLSLAAVTTVSGMGVAGWKIFESRAPERQRWRVSGSYFSSPTVADGVVYVGSYDLILLAVDADTGKQRWTFHTGNVVQSAPTVALGVVYVSCGDGNLYAVNTATGKQRWKFHTGKSMSSSPAVAQGVVYVGCDDGNLYAVDTDTGKQRWKFRTGAEVSSSPAVADGVVYVGSWDGNVYAVDTDTGKQRWKFHTDSLVSSSPAVADGGVYVGSWDGNLYAVDTDTGKQRWKFSPGDVVYSSPSVVDGDVFIGSNRNLYAVEADTGEQRWKLPAGGDMYSPTVADGVVYVGSDDGNLYAVDTYDGEQRWKFPTGSKVDSSPAVANGVVYACNDDGLYAVMT
ncbi:serine/threonine-protein kinase [Streptomyces avermitilis]|uniref:serine/threonine-protein kinase n=1 Tax=Streptomyces avermitilis TaxID=33903 RepID=UPI0033B50CFD